MARRRGDGPKGRKFDELLSQGKDPLEAAKLAGYTKPWNVVNDRKRWAAEALESKPAELSDREIALKTLRNCAQYASNESTQTSAASALLKHTDDDKANTPVPKSIVIMRGSIRADGTTPGVTIQGAVDPTDVADAVEYLRAQREGELEDFAAEHAVDRDELEDALELWRCEPARDAGLKIYAHVHKDDPDV